MGRRWLALVIALGVGIIGAVQGRANGELSTLVGSPLQAATISNICGLLLLAVVIALSPAIREGVLRLPVVWRERTAPRWAFLGGVVGAIFLSTQSAVVPVVGLAVFTVALVAGQTSTSLLVDRLGFGPGGARPLTWLRVAGAIVGVVAVYVSVSDRLGTAGFPLWAAALAFGAGALIAPQQAVNGRLSAATGQPIAATLANFTLGLVLLLVALVAVDLASGHPLGALPSDPWWVYLGGPAGVAFVATAAWAVKPLGLLLFALVTIGGQLLGALLIDTFAPTPGTTVGWHLVAGTVLTFVGVGLAAIRRTPGSAPNEAAPAAIIET